MAKALGGSVVLDEEMFRELTWLVGRLWGRCHMTMTWLRVKLLGKSQLSASYLIHIAWCHRTFHSAKVPGNADLTQPRDSAGMAFSSISQRKASRRRANNEDESNISRVAIEEIGRRKKIFELLEVILSNGKRKKARARSWINSPSAAWRAKGKMFFLSRYFFDLPESSNFIAGKGINSAWMSQQFLFKKL